ncbi:MAG: hypothetical protein R3A47_03305 [Polyangiales bacterium]
MRTEAERALLVTLQGNCHSAIAALATIDEGRLQLRAMVGDAVEQKRITAEADVYLELTNTTAAFKAAAALGVEIANNLIEQGARTLIRNAEIAALQRQQIAN